MRVNPVLCLMFLSLILPALALPGCSADFEITRWTPVAQPDLSDAEKAQFDAANAAREAMFGALMARLQAAMREGGAPVAIDVCRAEAPAIADETGEARGVQIGRTSFKLRNPENAPPAWAEAHVEARRAEPLILRGDNGALAALFPIMLKPECVQCHGPEDAIAPDVLAAIKKAYPADQATGFAEGDLRGWFHVTVPPAS